MLARGVGHRLGGGVGHGVGGAHHEGVKGELPGLHQGHRLFLLRVAVEAQALVIQQADGHVGGEDVLQTGLDVGEEAVLDIIALEVVGAVEHQGVPLQGNHCRLVKPGLDGSLRQVLPEAGEDHGPDIGYRLHRSSPFFCMGPAGPVFP